MGREKGSGEGNREGGGEGEREKHKKLKRKKSILNVLAKGQTQIAEGLLGFYNMRFCCCKLISLAGTFTNVTIAGNFWNLF